MLPALLLGIYALLDLMARDQRSQRNQLRETVRSLAASVDREWDTLHRKAALLAGVRQLASDGPATTELLIDAAQATGHEFVLFERNARAMNTLVATSPSLALADDIAAAGTVLSDEREHITSDAILHNGTPVAALLVSVPAGGAASRTLAIIPQPQRFGAILRGMPLPGGWVAAIDSPDNVIVARSERPEDFIGKRGRLMTSPGSAAVVSFVDLEGRPSIMAYEVSSRTGYRAVAWAPEAIFYASSAALTRWLFGLAAVALFFSLAGALSAAALISRPIRQLAEAAHTLEQGLPVVPRHTLMREANLVSIALSNASTNIGSREALLRRETEKTRFLVRELAHRLKNLMAVVLAMVRQTAGSAPPGTFAERFEARILGLARSVDLLVHSNWQGVPIQQVLEHHLAPFAETSRFSSSGPDLLLSAEGTDALGLALHELATNAVKHGALTGTQGTVSIDWHIVDGEFSFTWKERGGPVVKSPERRGFGRTIVERSVPAKLSGSAKLSFEPDGLKWTLKAPLDSVLAPETVTLGMGKPQSTPARPNSG